MVLVCVAGSLLRGRAATQFERDAEYALEHYVSNVYNEAAYANNQERLDSVNELVPVSINKNFPVITFFKWNSFSFCVMNCNKANFV